MNILAFDTCFGACSAAVGRGIGTASAHVETAFERRDLGHAEALMPMIERLMRAAGLAFDMLDRIAVTAGPGSFTGTRICVAAARAFALATPARIVAASSLAVIAHDSVARMGLGRGKARIVVAVDARRGQVYGQLFGRDGLDPLTGPAVLSIIDAAGLGGSDPIVLTGSGAPLVAEAATGLGRTVAAILPELQPDAAALLRMAPSLQPVAGALHPIYLREADAKPPAVQSIART